MPRDINANVEAQIAEFVNTSDFLIRIQYWDGEANNYLHLTTASQDIVTFGVSGIPNETWVGFGFPSGSSNIGIGIARETKDSSAQALEVSLNGVNTEIISLINNNYFRGRILEVWRVYLNGSGGGVDSGFLLWRGYMSEEFTIGENVPDNDEPRTAFITTRVVSRLSVLQRRQVVMTNVPSHNSMLARAGEATGDTGFSTTPKISNRNILWGGTNTSGKPFVGGTSLPPKDGDYDSP